MKKNLNNKQYMSLNNKISGKIFIYKEQFLFYKRYINNILYQFPNFNIIFIEELCEQNKEYWREYILKFINEHILGSFFLFFDLIDESLFTTLAEKMNIPLYIINITIDSSIQSYLYSKKWPYIHFFTYQDNGYIFNQIIKDTEKNNNNYILPYFINPNELIQYDKINEICLLSDDYSLQNENQKNKISKIFHELRKENINIKYYHLNQEEQELKELYTYKFVIIIDTLFHKLKYLHYIFNHCILFINEKYEKDKYFQKQCIYYNLSNLKWKVNISLKKYDIIMKNMYQNFSIDNITAYNINSKKNILSMINEYHTQNKKNYQKLILENEIQNLSQLKINKTLDNISNKTEIVSDISSTSIEISPSTTFIETNQMHEIAFIMLRHVNSIQSNLLWKTNIEHIRKYYDYPIIIIDDNSDLNFIDEKEESYQNVRVIYAEFHKRGEILPYYYIFHYKLCKKAIIIHDGTFINQNISFDTMDKPIYYLWHFTHDWDEEEEELKLLSLLNNQNLIDFYHEKKWYGCFGVQTIVNYNFLDIIFHKYNISLFIDYIDTRPKRMNFERIFSVLCSYEYQELYEQKSLYGIIHHYIHWGYNFEQYIEDKKKIN